MNGDTAFNGALMIVHSGGAVVTGQLFAGHQELVWGASEHPTEAGQQLNIQLFRDLVNQPGNAAGADGETVSCKGILQSLANLIPRSAITACKRHSSPSFLWLAIIHSEVEVRIDPFRAVSHSPLAFHRWRVGIAIGSYKEHDAIASAAVCRC
ncbi:MAG: hypothetical protein JWM42_3727 [Burkholderia sp.]|nr:hypothetical protein [Burkholderia sp.]